MLQPRFRGLRVGAPQQRNQTGLRQRVTRIDVQYFQIMFGGIVGSVFMPRDGRESEQCVDIGGLAARGGFVQAPRGIKASGLQRGIGIAHHGIDARRRIIATADNDAGLR